MDQRPKQELRVASGTFLECLRQFLTPEVWKQAHRTRGVSRRSPRWQAQPLVLVLLFMTWCCGDSVPERFETAKAYCAVCLSKRRRPGKSVQGFQKALCKMPASVLRAVATAMRQRLLVLFSGAAAWMDSGFVPLGADGSRLECPRAAELEQHLGQAGKEDSAPTLWVTALVHLRLGLLWSWRLGKGTASERGHVEQMLTTLPASALIVADAGFNGFGLAQAIVGSGASFLIRMSAKVTLLTEAGILPQRFREGSVYYWPRAAQKGGEKPLKVRLLRIRGKKKGADVWLLTNILDGKRLTLARAAQFYRWRWENEGLFRAYKRTLGKVKLLSRTVSLVHREAEGSLLAMQILLAQGALALRAKDSDVVTPMCSPRKVLLLIRSEIQGRMTPRQRNQFHDRLMVAIRDRRIRMTAKVKRKWPRRGDHKAPQPPKIRKLTTSQKDRIYQFEHVAA